MSLVPAHVRAVMCDQYGKTALRRAAMSGSAECVAALLAVDGIGVNLQDRVRHSVDTHRGRASAHWGHAGPASCRGHAPSRWYLKHVLA